MSGPRAFLLVFLLVSVGEANPATATFVTGTVTSAGGPAGDEIRIRLKAPPSSCAETPSFAARPWTGTLDNDGRFRVDLPALGVWLLEFERSDGTARRTILLEPSIDALDLGEVSLSDEGKRRKAQAKVPESGAVQDRTSRARPDDAEQTVPEPNTSSLAGTVSQKASTSQSRPGRPIEGALVWLQNRPTCFTRTDGQGRFRLLSADGAIPLGTIIVVQKPGFRRETLRVQKNQNESSVALRLERRVGVIQGSVRSSGSKPVPWAKVEAWEGRQTVSDERGQFTLTDLEAGRGGPIYASATGYSDGQETATAKPPPVSPLSIVLPHLRTISGRVIDPHGHPARDVEVRVIDGYVEKAQTVSDERGAFALGPVAPGHHRIVARREGHATLERRVNLPDDPGPFDLGDIELPWELTVRGTVVDGDGFPVSGAEVFVHRDFLPDDRQADLRPQRSPDATSDRDGTFEVGELGTGPLTLEIWKKGFTPRTVHTEVDRAFDPPELEVELQASRELRIRVVDERGEPVAGTSVMLGIQRPPGSEQFGGSRPPFKTSDSGEVQVDLRGGSTVQIDVLPDRWARAHESVTLPEEPGTTRVTIHLSRSATLKGSVLGTNGEPVNGASVTVRAPESPLPLDGAATDSAGQFSVDWLPPGRLVLEVSHRGYETLRVPLDLSSGTTTRRLSLRPLDTATLIGSVLEDGQWPVAGAQGSLRSASTGRTWAIATDADGVFRVQEIPFGIYEVSVTTGRFVPTADSTLVQVERPEERLNIAVARPCTVEGLVTGIGTVLANHLRVMASGSGLRLPLAVDSTARVVRGTLPPGEWTIQGSIAGGSDSNDQVSGAVCRITCEAGESVSFELAF